MHVQIAARNYVVYLFRWETIFGLELFSAEVNTAQLKATAHFLPTWYKLLLSIQM
jgi:hypothetical protein